MTAFDLLLIALFAWYVSCILIRTDGPWHVFARLRKVTTVGGLLECMYCLAPWMAALAYLLLAHTDAQEIVYIGAAAGLGMILHRYTGGDHV